MAGSADQGQPGSRPEQEIDLANEDPSPGAYEAPLDRIHVGATVGGKGFAGQADFRVKGHLRRMAEYVVLSLCSSVNVLVFGWLRHRAQVMGWTILAVSALAGIATFTAGAWFLSFSPMPSKPSRRRNH